MGIESFPGAGFPELPGNGFYLTNPSTGEDIRTPEAYDADLQRMDDSARTDIAARAELKTIDQILGGFEM